jgi:hypothetical protein
MMQLCSVGLSVALALAGISMFSSPLVSAEASGVAGTWRGESLCVTDAPACHNESVVYYIKDVPDQPDLVLIQADKIVDAEADHDGNRAVALRPRPAHVGRLVGPLAAKWSILEEYILGPIHIPRHALVMTRFGFHAIQPASHLTRSSFQSEPAKAPFRGSGGAFRSAA